MKILSNCNGLIHKNDSKCLNTKYSKEEWKINWISIVMKINYLTVIFISAVKVELTFLLEPKNCICLFSELSCFLFIVNLISIILFDKQFASYNANNQ